MLAAEGTCPQAVTILLEHGAHTILKDAHGRTVIERTVFKNSEVEAALRGDFMFLFD